jgi:hypothetical protein
LTPSVWRIVALPKIVEEIVSGVLVVFEFFHFMWALLTEVAKYVIKHVFTANCNNAVNYPSTPLLRVLLYFYEDFHLPSL